MTSKIVVNNIEADAGVSTVTFASEVTAPTFNGNIVGTAATFSGNVDIAGALTYEDVTNVDSVGIVTARSGIHVTGGSVGIGTDNPSHELDIESVSPTIELKDSDNDYKFQLTQSGSASYIDFDTDGGGSSSLRIRNAYDEKIRIQSDGKVGIGTNNPNYLTTFAADGPNAKLNIKRKTAAASNGNAFGSLFYTNSDGTDVASIRAHRESANDDAYLGFATRNTGGSISEKLRVSSDGKLTATRTSTTAYDSAATTNDSGFLLLNNGAAGHATLQFQSLSSGTAQTGQATISSFNETAGSKDTALTFGTRQSSDATIRERLRIDSGGRIAQGGKTPTNHGSPNLLLWGSDTTLHLTSTGSVNNSSLTGIKFAVAGGSTGDYSKAGIFVQRQDSYNDLDMIFAFRSSNDAVGVTISDEKLRINSDGNVGINHSDPTMRLYVKETGADISNGNAILNSTQKGIRLEVNSNDDKSLGLWFSTGSHHSGISGQRNDSANTWGTDLRFYTHEDATNDLTYTRERHRINPHGMLVNRKGQNAVNTGGNILGRYKYTQINQGSGYGHLILGPDGRKLQDYITTNSYCIITVCVTGTGTDNMYCQYRYHSTSSASIVTLNHMYGNNGSSSNRPYMDLVNTSDPVWKMSHNGGYRLDIEVAIYGGANAFTFTDEFGDFTTNP